METRRILTIISISALMILTLSGMAGAIGFSYTDTTSSAASGTPGITYTVAINNATGQGTLTVTGGNSAWTLNSVSFKFGGVKLDGSPQFFTVDIPAPAEDPDANHFGTIPEITFNVGTVTGTQDTWSLQANFSDDEAGNSGHPITNQISVTPEPGTLFLIGSGLLGIAALRYAKARRKK